jgi:hypothetical protein
MWPEAAARQLGTRHPRQMRDLRLQRRKRRVGAHLREDEAAFHLAEGAEPRETHRCGGQGRCGQEIVDRLEHRIADVSEKSEREVQIVLRHVAAKGNPRLNGQEGRDCVFRDRQGEKGAHGASLSLSRAPRPLPCRWRWRAR